MMGLASHSLSVFSLTKQPNLGFGRPNLPLRDAPSSLLASQTPRFGLVVSSATSNGNRRGRPQQKTSSSSLGRAKKGPVENKKLSGERSASKPSKSNQEEIISLFKRIQSSISEGESGSFKEKENDVGSSEDEPATETLVDILRQSRKKIEVAIAGDNSVGKERKSQSMKPNANAKLARPPSDFKKRSPISPLSGPREKIIMPKRGGRLKETTAEKNDEKALVVENMKLAGLKGLARARGIKGYSKLKKSDLVELLRSSSSLL